MPDPLYNNEEAAEYVSYYASKQMVKNTVNRLYHNGVARQRAAVAKVERELYPPRPLAKRSPAQIEAYLQDRVEKELLRRQQHRASLRRALYGDETLVSCDANSYNNNNNNNNKFSHKNSSFSNNNNNNNNIYETHSSMKEEEQEQELPYNMHDHRHRENKNADHTINNYNKRSKEPLSRQQEQHRHLRRCQNEEIICKLNRHRYLSPHELRMHIKHVYTDPVKRRAKRQAEIEKFLEVYGTTNTITKSIRPSATHTPRKAATTTKAMKSTSSSSSLSTPAKDDHKSNSNKIIIKGNNHKMSNDYAKMSEEERLRELEIGWRTPSLKVSHDAEDIEKLWVTPSMEILNHKNSNKTRNGNKNTSRRDNNYWNNGSASKSAGNKKSHHMSRSVSISRLTELARPLHITPHAKDSNEVNNADDLHLTGIINNVATPFQVYRKVEYNDEDAYL